MVGRSRLVEVLGKPVMEEKCIVCESPVSNRDQVCGNCGTPIDSHEKLRSCVGKIVIAIFLLALLGGIVWLFQYLTA